MDKRKAAEAAAAAASVRRLYRVREEGGVEATRTPDLMAPTVDLIEAGAAFYGKAEVCVCVCLPCVGGSDGTTRGVCVIELCTPGRRFRAVNETPRGVSFVRVMKGEEAFVL